MARSTLRATVTVAASCMLVPQGLRSWLTLAGTSAECNCEVWGGCRCAIWGQRAMLGKSGVVASLPVGLTSLLPLANYAEPGL
jgi:hypothetical protein